MNILKRTTLVRKNPTCLHIRKNQIYSKNDLTHDIFENEKCIDKFEEFKEKKIIYKKDYKDYMKLYECYKPYYTKLIVEKRNYFNFSICWTFNDERSVCVSNDTNKKVKSFTDTLCKLKVELSKIRQYIDNKENGLQLSGVRKSQDRDTSSLKNVRTVNIAATSVNFTNSENKKNITDEERKQKEHEKISEKLSNEWRNNPIPSSAHGKERDSYVDKPSDTKQKGNRSRYQTREQEEEEEKKNSKKMNYTKLNKIWESFLFHKERSNIKEEKINFEILRKTFLKAQFFEKNKKKDFQFFENILTDLLLRPDIFISALNSLYFIFFDMKISDTNCYNVFLKKEKVHTSSDFSRSGSYNLLYDPSKEECIHSCKNIEREKKISGSVLLHLANPKKEKEDEQNSSTFAKKQGSKEVKKARNSNAFNEKNTIDESIPYKIPAKDETSGKIRRYILNYLFNIYYEKHIGLKNMHKTFDIHLTYKLRYCKKEGNLYKFIASRGIEIENRNIILIKCNKISGSFLVGLVKKIQKTKDFSILYVNIKRYNCNKIGTNVVKLYEEMDLSDEYMEIYFNKTHVFPVEFSHEFKNPCIFTSTSRDNCPNVGDIHQNEEKNDTNVYEAVILSVHLSTISNRIKYSMLSLFEKKKQVPNNQILELLLNEEYNHSHVCASEESLSSCAMMHRDGGYNFLIQEAINKFFQNRKNEMTFLNIINKDLIKNDKIVGKLHKKLKNNMDEFSRMCNVYIKFDIYQKNVLRDILLNEGEIPVHLIRGKCYPAWYP